MAKTGNSKPKSGTRITRRRVLTGMTAATAAGFTMKSTGPFIRDAKAATMTLRALIWEPYNLKDTVTKFEEETGARWAPSFFDGNSEAFNKMKGGGTQDFDLVMADGHWPRTYYKQGLTQAVDYGRLSNMSNVYDAFLPPNYLLDRAKDGDEMIASPNCWGGYGTTINTEKVDLADAESIEALFMEKYGGHIVTSARFEENIALTGVMVADKMGTKTAPRPDGQPFNPYVLTDEELAECKRWLIVQKPLLLTRYQDYDMTERLMVAGQAWLAPEFGLSFRALIAKYRNGELSWKAKHILKPKEGGLGWVDNWMISSGVEDSEKLELCHDWLDRYLSKENMASVAVDVRVAPTVDVRDMLDENLVADLLMDEVEAVKGLYMFDQPSSPEKWERIWSEVEAA